MLICNSSPAGIAFVRVVATIPDVPILPGGLMVMHIGLYVTGIAVVLSEDPRTAVYFTRGSGTQY